MKEMISEYKKAKKNRHNAAILNNLQDVDTYNEEIDYWYKKINKKIESDGISIEEVRKMLINL